jgi:hypothetical protein
MRPVLDRTWPLGLDVVAAVLTELGTDADAVAAWTRRHQERALGSPGSVMVSAA